MKIRDLEILDLRFPTSRTNAGTDAMHPDPDYSAAYVILEDRRRTSRDTASRSRSAAATRSAPRRSARSVISSSAERSRRSPPDPAAFWRALASEIAAALARPREGRHPPRAGGDRQRRVGSARKRERKPVWKLLADMTPQQIVACIDFRYITDALTPDEAVEMLERQASTQGASAKRELLRDGYPAYTTSAGWMGYSDDNDSAAVPRGARRRLDALQGEGRRRARRRRARASGSCARRSARSAS